MDNDKLINTKKMVFDSHALRLGFPYVLWFNHRRLYVSYESGNSSELKFNYFNSNNEYCEITLHIGDPFEVMPMTSNTEALVYKDYDDMVNNINIASSIIDSWHSGGNDDNA